MCFVVGPLFWYAHFHRLLYLFLSLWVDTQKRPQEAFL